MPTLRRWPVVVLMALAVCVGADARSPVETLPQVSEVTTGYADRDSVCRRLEASGMHAIEGVWTFPSDGTTVAVERADDAAAPVRYRMVILRSARRSLPAGTVMGLLAPTSHKGVYAASVYTATLGGTRLTSPRRFTLKLIDASHLAISADKKLKFTFNFWKFIPYLSNALTIRGRSVDSTPDDLDGCVREYPLQTSDCVEPRYL